MRRSDDKGKSRDERPRRHACSCAPAHAESAAGLLAASLKVARDACRRRLGRTDHARTSGCTNRLQSGPRVGAKYCSAPAHRLVRECINRTPAGRDSIAQHGQLREGSRTQIAPAIGRPGHRRRISHPAWSSARKRDFTCLSCIAYSLFRDCKHMYNKVCRPANQALPRDWHLRETCSAWSFFTGAP